MSTTIERIEWNTRYSVLNAQRAAESSALMTRQMSELLDIGVEQLAVSHATLSMQNEQLNVQQEILRVNEQHLVVSQQQLVRSLKIIQRLDITNHRLSQIDASLTDISGLLVQQNALIQKSLNQLANESQELIQRGLEAYGNQWYKDAARDFEAALAKNPYSAVGHYFLGKCHFHEGRTIDYEQAYQKCIYYARKNAPIFHCLALCDLAGYALKEKKTEEARQYLEMALACPELDKLVLVDSLLQCDVAENLLSDRTCRFILTAFSDETVDPEVLLEIVCLRVAGIDSESLKKRVSEERVKWEAATRNALFQRLISHFYRELDDFVYLAPRVRQGFMEAAGGKFLSLGDPISDVLDWTVMIGEQLLKRIELFPPEYPTILRFYRPLQTWNAMLIRMNRLVGVLSTKSNLVNGQFVEKLNLGMIEVPRPYEDDTLLFEVNTEEGDTLALSCYYAIFTRNGTDHFPIPLHEYGILKLDATQTSPVRKAVVVVDPRHGQTLIQGNTGCFSWSDNDDDRHFLIDSFIEVASLLADLHECIEWMIRHESELFSTFLLLHAVAEKMTKRRNAIPRSHQSRLRPEQPLNRNTEDGFEVLEDTSSGDDGFEVVEEHDTSNPNPS